MNNICYNLSNNCDEEYCDCDSDRMAKDIEEPIRTNFDD